jgi:hypothetical protein
VGAAVLPVVVFVRLAAAAAAAAGAAVAAAAVRGAVVAGVGVGLSNGRLSFYPQRFNRTNTLIHGGKKEKTYDEASDRIRAYANC